MNDVHQVWTPIGGLTAARFPKTCKSPPTAIVMMIRRGAKPEIPIESRWRIGVRRRHLLAVLARKSQSIEIGLDVGDLADFSTANQVHDLLIVLARALLRSARYDAIVLGGRLHHLAALINRMRDGLFHVHIFARLARHNHRNAMPVF